MRIAMLSLHSGPLDQPGEGSSGGMNVYIQDLSRALATVDVAQFAPGVRVFSVPAGPVGPVAKGDIANLVPALLEGIDDVAGSQTRPYGLVHSHYWASGMVGQRLARRWNVPHVQMFHTLSRIKTKYAGSAPDPRRERAEVRLLRLAHAIVVSNPVERMQILEQYPKQCAHLVSIPCGVDIKAFHPRQGAASPSEFIEMPVDRRFTVVALGRLERLKNFGLLLEAAALAGAREPRFAGELRITVAGGVSSDEPEEAERLRALARSLNLVDAVRFVGPVPRTEIPALYAAADVCVVPSLHESFGLVALEAMASGLPVIATRSGGMQMTVVNGVSGFLVDPRDPSELADRLLKLWASPACRRSMGRHGERTAQHYAWPLVAERMLCLYRALLAGRTRYTRDPRLDRRLPAG
jgi:D-inositol-3-phosphate glycosyltransferase